MNPAAILLIVAAGIAAYHNSFSGVFLFDDRGHIISSVAEIVVHRSRPLGEILTGSRPILQLTFILNHFLSGLRPWSYHLVNLAIHVFAGLTLFWILRRTFLTESLKVRYGEKARGLALTISLLWLLHPLQTQSVTYIIQRGESLMGLFYLMTLYSVIRGWKGRAILCCALGMATKEIMVTAPVVVLAYDRIFLASSFKEIFQKRKGLYLGLLATWAVLLMGSPWLLNPGKLASGTIGFGVKGLTPLQYALSQPGVIVHYLGLCFFPHPLVIDYLWPVAETWQAILFPGLLVSALLILTFWALRFHPALGFLGLWFFLILAPTSSFIPIVDLAFEHRMYLPLASVITLAVIGGYQLLPSYPVLAKSFVCLLAVSLGILTFLRNRDYQDEVRLWQDTVRKKPENWRAYNNLGSALLKERRWEGAAASYREALKRNPDYVLAHYNIATILDAQGKLDEAVEHYREALRIDPTYANAHSNLGAILSQQGKLDEAIFHYIKVLEFNPTFAEGYYNLGNAYLKQERWSDAMAQYSKALQLKPQLEQARRHFEIALAKQKEKGYV